MYQNSGKNYLAVGLLLGVVAGVALGLILAPKKGAETREMLKEKLASGAERLRQFREERMRQFQREDAAREAEAEIE